MAADPIKIGVGGYYTFYVMAGSMEGSYATNGSYISFKSPVFWQEGEIHFIGQTKLDNGTTVGVRVELEGWNPATTAGAVAGQNRQIDEAFLFAFGDWGRIEFGAHDGAAYQMSYGAPSALIQHGFLQYDSSIGWLNPIASANNLAAARITSSMVGYNFQDVNEFNYYTPRFAGLQVGFTYAPKIQLASPAPPAFGMGTGPGNNSAGICGYNDATAVANCPNSDFSWQDVFQVGVNYLNKFGDVSVALYFGYLNAAWSGGQGALQPVTGAGTGSNMNLLPVGVASVTTGVNLAAWKQWTAGAQFSYAGFTVGGSVGWDNNGLGNNYLTQGDNDTRFYTASIMYETGPWQMSFGWGYAVNDNGNGSATLVAIAQGTNAATYNVSTANATCNYLSGNNMPVTGQSPNIAQGCFGGGATFGSLSATKFEVGANYALGPGIKLTGGAIFNNLSGPTNATSAQSWAALFGMDLRF
jgi:hypothetical protein